ncbi:MAG: hypothetical protein LCH67_10465 [Bacteroidetes bacterium]|nr:hypothetical protein [Bacteroidota bacterium]
MNFKIVEFFSSNEKKILKYWPLIPTLTLVLGGFWQIISLTSISVRYIRFFSVGQLLSDSIILLILFFTIGFPIVFTNNVFTGLFKNIKLENGLKEFPLIWKLLPILFFLLFLLKDNLREIFLQNFKDILSLFNPYDFDLSKMVNGILFLNIFLLVNSYIIIWIARIFINLSNKLKFNRLRLFSGVLSKTIFGLLFLEVFVLIIKINGFIVNYSIPQNSINFKKEIIELEKKYSSQKVKILYFNDKYVFIKIDEEILIKKLDEIFE